MIPRFAAVVVLSGAIMPALLLGTRAATTARTTPEEALDVFENRVADYVDLQRECMRRIRRNGVERVSHVPASYVPAAFEEALGDAIRDARRGARPGDILSPALATLILQMVRTDLASRAFLEREAILEEVPPMQIQVNDRYPLGALLPTTPPLLLARLPPLAPELQYRFLGRTLILFDVDANLIVDVIPEALPERP